MAQTGTSLVPPPAFSSAAAGAACTLALAASAPRPAPTSATATAAPPAATTRRQRRASGRPFDRPVFFMTSPLFRPSPAPLALGGASRSLAEPNLPRKDVMTEHSRASAAKLKCALKLGGLL